jgi:hypothetical protein
MYVPFSFLLSLLCMFHISIYLCCSVFPVVFEVARHYHAAQQDDGVSASERPLYARLLDSGLIDLTDLIPYNGSGFGCVLG